MRLEGQGLLGLVDPARTNGAEAARIGRAAKAAGVRGFLIGSSFDGAAQTHEVARALRDSAPGVPVALFPGSAMQLTDQVDLVLFLSLVSGRNPQYLIEEHVRAVPFLQQHPVPTLSTAYRSEEHTSELQSQSNLVCRLLLDKKKQDNPDQTAAADHLPTQSNRLAGDPPLLLRDNLFLSHQTAHTDVAAGNGLLVTAHRGPHL